MLMDSVILCALSVLLGMVIMWCIFIFKASHNYRTKTIKYQKPKEDIKPIKHEEDLKVEKIDKQYKLYSTDEGTILEKISILERIRYEVSSIFSSHKSRVFIGSIFVIGLVVGIFLGYQMMDEVNDGLMKRQKQNHIGYVIDNTEKNSKVITAFSYNRGGDFIEKVYCS